MQVQSKKQKRPFSNSSNLILNELKNLGNLYSFFVKKNNNITCPQTYVKLATHESCPCEFDICTVVQCHSQ